MIKTLITVVLALFALNAPAATTYFCDATGTGADPAAVSGSNGNAGNVASAPKQTLTAAIINAAVLGDNLLLCKGGAQNGFQVQVNTSLTPYQTAKVTIDVYTSPNFSTSATRSRLNPSSDKAFQFLHGLSTSLWGGYVINNIEIHGGDAAGTGVIDFVAGINDVTINNMKASHTYYGFGCSNGFTGLAGIMPRGIMIRGLDMSYVNQMGFGGFSCENVTLENFLMDHVSDCTGLDSSQCALIHPIYLSGNTRDAPDYALPAQGNVIRGGVITNSCLGSIPAPTKCNCAMITGHSRILNMTIEDNELRNPPGGATDGCWGIAVAPANGFVEEYEQNYTIRRNKLINVGGNAILSSAMQNGLIENNDIVFEGTTNQSNGIMIQQDAGGTNTTYRSNRIKVRNNSMYFANATYADGITLNDQGTQHEVTGNLLYFGTAGSTTHCFGNPLAFSSYTAWDRNLCFAASGTLGWTPTHATKAAFTSASGGSNFDANSLTSDPLLVAAPSSTTQWLMPIQSGSPARAAASASLAPSRDFTTCVRPTPPAIGAFDYFASACGTKSSATATQLR